MSEQGFSSSHDEHWMRAAIDLAQAAKSLGEVPVGCVIVLEGQLIARAHNRTIIDNDPCAHAEVLALRQAGAAIGNYRLNGCELYSTVEPCAMCVGAMVHARIARLIYGAPDTKAGAAGSVLEIANHPRLNHRFSITAGMLAPECADLLQSFFRAKRRPREC